MAVALAVTVTLMLCCVPLAASQGSISFQFGMLATPTAPYLDGSNRWFQQGRWHLGKGTRTWGETYGIKVWRIYASVGVQHTDASITPSEAEE